MAASAQMPGGCARSRVGLISIAACAFAAAGAAVASPVRAEPAIIYTSAPQGYATGDLGAALRRALGASADAVVKPAATAPEVMQRVADDPRSVGLVQRDFYVQYARDHANGATRFEFYGNIPVCLMAVVRSGSPIHTFGDLVRQTARRTTLDVGPADGQLAQTFDTFRGLDRSLANLELEHRGGARPLGRIVSGETDAALFIVRAPYEEGLALGMIEGGVLDAVPFFSEDIVLGAARRDLPYLLRQIALGRAGWFAAARPYHTTCTSLGAVVNSTATAALSEQVARVVLGNAPSDGGRPWYVAVGNAFVVAFAEVERLVTGAGDVVVAWFTPAKPGSAIAEAPTNAPQFQPVRDGGGERRQPATAPSAAR